MRKMSYGALKHSPLCSAEVYALGVPLCGLHRPFCCCGTDYCGSLMSMASP